METVQRFVPKKLVVTFVIAGSFWTACRVVGVIRRYLAQQRMLEKWKVTPKDIVIVHTLPRGKKAPSTSPFVLKLETFLRMYNIPYQMDFEYPWGSKAKTPWITLNGEHLADSQLIIEHLSATFSKVEENNYSEEQLALARTVRIMMEEHFYWGLGLWKYVYSEGKGLSEIFDMSPTAQKAFYKMANTRVKIASAYQGIGRHNPADVIKIMKKNLRTVSILIGTKKFILGDEPCQDDCSIFGFLAQALWCAPGSPYEIVVKDELVNLNEYCIRMKEAFFPDWEKCLAGQQTLQLI